MLGIYGVILAYVNPITTVFKLGIPQYILTVDDENQLYNLNKIAVINSFLFLVIAGLISSVLNDNFKLLMFSLCFLKSSQMIRETFESNYIVSNHDSKLFKFIFIGNIFSIIIFLCFYYLFNNLSLSILSSGIVYLSFSLKDIFKIFNYKIELKVENQKINTLLKITLSKFLNSFKSSLPKLVGQTFLSLDNLGVLTLLQQGVNLLDIANNVLIKYNNRQIVKGFKNQSKIAIKRAVYGYVVPHIILLVVSCVFLISLGYDILSYIFNEKIASHNGLLIMLIFFKFISMLISFPKISFIIYDKVNITLILLLFYILLTTPFLFLSSSLNNIVIVLLIFELLLFIGFCFLSFNLFRVKC